MCMVLSPHVQSITDSGCQGCEINTDRVDVFNSGEWAWSTASLSQPRERLAATSVGKVAFFAGGLLNFNWSCVPMPCDNRYSKIDVYDTEARIWSTINGVKPRYDLAATSVSDVAIFAGGNVGTLHSAVAEWHHSSINSYFL